MQKFLFSLILFFILFFSAAWAAPSGNGADLSGDVLETGDGKLIIHPVNHATFVAQLGGKTIYVDPVGGRKLFEGLPEPDIILLTDIHQDHLDQKTLEAVATAKTKIVAPPSAADKLPEAAGLSPKVLKNGESTQLSGIKIEAVPMYNMTKDRMKFHPKGRGNGYVLGIGNTRLYISGDTEDAPEMRSLENIQAAVVCMNLPYTMDVEQAADAVLAFRPKVVYPYHYRGAEGAMSDVKHFKEMVESKSDIEVRLLNWY